MSRLIFLFLAPYFMLASNPHPIHISKCQIEHDRTSKNLQITLHVFMDDLEKAIEQEGIASGLDLGKKSEHPSADQAIANYIKSHLRLTQNGKEIPITYKRKQISDDNMAFWCFLEAGPVKKLQNIRVEYDVLMEVYDDQKNIFNIISSDMEEKYHLFKNKNQYFEINF